MEQNKIIKISEKIISDVSETYDIVDYKVKEKQMNDDYIRVKMMIRVNSDSAEYGELSHIDDDIQVSVRDIQNQKIEVWGKNNQSSDFNSISLPDDVSISDALSK